MSVENIYTLRVHIEDTDFTGLVYHANFIKFMERARSEWLNNLGFGLPWQQEQGIGFVIRSIQIDYLKPVYAHEVVEVVTKVKTLRRVSTIFEQHLRSASDSNKIHCKAETNVVCIDRHLQPCALPDPIRYCGEF